MKKVLSVVLAMIMLCSAIALTSCDFNDIINGLKIENDPAENKPGDKKDDVIAPEQDKFDQDYDSGETPVEVDNINGKTVEQIYEETEQFLHNLSEYEISGTRYLKAPDVDKAFKSVESEIQFITKLAKNSAYCQYSNEEAIMEYFYVDGYKYWISKDKNNAGAEVIHDPENMTKVEFVADSALGFDFTNFGNWANKKYLNLKSKKFLKLGEDYTLKITLTDDEVKEYYEEKVELSIIETASLTVELMFDKNGKLKAYKYDTEFSYKTLEGVSVSNVMRWDISIDKTEKVEEIKLPEGIDKPNPGDAKPGKDTVDEKEEPANVAHHNGIKYYKGTLDKIGDMNNDGKITEFDLYCQEWGEYDDMDGNGVINYADIVAGFTDAGATKPQAESSAKEVISQYAKSYNKNNK